MLKIEKYRSSDEDLWDSFIHSSNNGTLFHLRSFLNYHPKDRFIDHSLIITKKGKLFSVFPAAEQIINNNKFLVSHPGASIGSFVVREDLSIADSMELVKLLVVYTRGNKFKGIRITLPPNLYQYRLSDYLEFSFFKNDFIYVNRDITSILFLEKTIEKTLKKFRSSHKRSIRKAKEYGITVRQSQNFPAFYKILKQNLKIRHHVSPTHSVEELINIQKLFPSRCNLFGAYLQNKMIAGVVNFVINKHVLLAFYISHDENYSELRSVNLLFYTIFEWAIESGYVIYDFGTFTVKEEPNMGLGRFKESFGASGIFRDTIELVLP